MLATLITTFYVYNGDWWLAPWNIFLTPENFSATPLNATSVPNTNNLSQYI